VSGPPRRGVSVVAPARLHLGFLDLGGGDRRFGSVGLTLEEITCRVRAAPAPTQAVDGAQRQRVEHYVRLLRERFGFAAHFNLVVEQAIPEHAGLGSGTQLALTVATAVANLLGVHWPPGEIASALARGGRSGIGIGAFEQGGFLVDGGRGQGDGIPPIVSRIPFPEAWRVVLILDRQILGLHGAQEIAAFSALPAFPRATAEHLCHLVLLQALPALAENDITLFGSAINELQQIVGDYFSPAQGGRYSSPRVAEALAWLQAQGVACVGQSSWGPTGFAVVDSHAKASALAQAGQGRAGESGALRFVVCRGRNRGHELNCL
jgi:beta-ribofuranosylaminobenzene 5'-phosphate synthase